MFSRLTIALSAAMLAGAICASPAHAQRRGGGMGMHRFPQGRPARPQSTNIGGTIRIGHPERRGEGRRSRGYFLWPYWFPESVPYEPAPPQPAPAQVVVVKPPAPPQAPPQPPPPSLLLQYKDGQWVRVPTGDQLPTNTASEQASSARVQRPPAPAQTEEAKPVPTPPVVLVFRDGHKEQIKQYVIEGNFLYAQTDYWTSGSWTQKIPIAKLDVPATVKFNRQRGAKFQLPSSPNEVVLGF